MKLTNFSGGKTKADEKNQLPKLLIRQVKQIQNKTKENKKEPAANAPDPSSYFNKRSIAPATPDIGSLRLSGLTPNLRYFRETLSRRMAYPPTGSRSHLSRRTH